MRSAAEHCLLQLLLNTCADCPLLPPAPAVLSCSAVTNTVAVPCSVLVPFIALVFGVYPLVLNRQFALAATLYYTSSTLVTMVGDMTANSAHAAAPQHKTRSPGVAACCPLSGDWRLAACMCVQP
jgi:hypothetical protein